MSPPTVALAVFLAAACSAPDPGRPGSLRAQSPSADELVPVELATVGIDGVTGAPIVLLRDPKSAKVVPIWIGMAEAQAIALALHGVAVPRPMTHDLMAGLLSALRAEVEEVLVHDLRDNTYFGTVRLRVTGEETLRDVDSRPSDAMALAVRTGARIRVARKILVAEPTYEFIAPEGSGQVVRTLGITLVSATPELRKEFGLGDRAGAVVTDAFGRAREAGLRRGDLIVEVNGTPVREPMDFFEGVRSTRAGEMVRIRSWRAGETREIELPADLPPAAPRDRPVVA